MHIAVSGNQSRALVNFWTVLMAHMQSRGHRVTCLVPPGDPQADAELREQGHRLIHYPLDRKGLNPLRDALTTAALWRILRRERPDVLFASTIKPVIYGCLAARAAGIPHIFAAITGLGYAFEADSAAKKILNSLAAQLYRTALAGAQAIFFQNEDDRRTFADAGILKANAHTIMTKGTGVDTARFGLVPPVLDPPTFLLVGRLLEAKGLYEYAIAARSLKARYPQARFQILGPPEEGRGAVPLSTVLTWQDEGCIEYLGHTRDVRPFVAACSVIVLPSWREGTPCAVMEGMSMGKAAIVTNAPGCREVVIEADNGFYVPLRDPQALADAMERFILHPEWIIALGVAGRRRAEEVFDANTVAAHMCSAMNIE